MEEIHLAIIGGSGLYDFPGLSSKRELKVSTPFGEPSAPIILGELEGKRVAFLARHGVGHTISPSEVNSQANIFALKILGAANIISISACGSLKEEIAPGDMVIPDNLFDFTRNRKRSFFGKGLVAHVSVADPFCTNLGDQLGAAMTTIGSRKVHRSGTLITIEGPRFSTRAESRLYRQWGMSIIGMTTSPEAFLAREAEMCYSVMAHVTDYDVWHSSASPVTVEMVIKVLNENTSMAQQVIKTLVQSFKDENDCSCRSALKSALITPLNLVPKETLFKLEPLIGKYQK